MRIAECGSRNVGTALAEPVATSLLDLRFQIDHKPLTELLVSMRPQTAVARWEMRIAECETRNLACYQSFRTPQSAFHISSALLPQLFRQIQCSQIGEMLAAADQLLSQ
jgi:hypothetical protein